MTTETEITPPFGTYTLPPRNEAWRQRALQYHDTKLGRMMISYCRKKALAGQSEPFDVKVDDRLTARVHPSDNRCEKRIFAGPQIWEAVERQALKDLIDADDARSFVFLDVGANVGFYALYVHSYAHELARPVKIVAIEPNMKTCGRLEDNIALNKADIQIVRAAVSSEPGSGYLSHNETNRGEDRLAPRVAGGNSDAVVIDTLTRICRAQGISHVNAMKVDIEGHDYIALKGFFEDAPLSLHPEMLILETRQKDEIPPIMALCEQYAYVVKSRTRQNTIFIKASHV